MGHVVAFDNTTGKKLWEKRIYEARINPLLEKDVQDVFITNLTIKNEKLIITTEKDEYYSLDLKTKEVIKLKTGSQ